MKTLRTAAIVGGMLVLSGLTACVTPTPYQPVGTVDAPRDGYAEAKIEDNRYRLKFSGNTATPRDTVETYLLYRAAELTLEKGYDTFIVVSRNTDAHRREVSTYENIGYGRFSWRYYRGGWGPWGSGLGLEVDSRTFEQFEAEGEIVMSKGPKPDNAPNAYDARQVKDNLEGKIVRPTHH